MKEVFTTRNISTYLREKQARLDNSKGHAEFSQHFPPKEEQQCIPYVKTKVREKKNSSEEKKLLKKIIHNNHT
jgi:hypothetical protein